MARTRESSLFKIADLRVVQTFEQLRLGFGDFINGFEKLEVNGIHVRDDAFIRLGNRRQLANLAFRRHAHLEDADVLIPLDAKQAKRQTKLVIEISNGAQNREFFPENGRDHFFRRRLAGASCHADDRHSPSAGGRRAQASARLRLSMQHESQDAAPATGHRAPQRQRPPFCRKPVARTRGRRTSVL